MKNRLIVLLLLLLFFLILFSPVHSASPDLDDNFPRWFNATSAAVIFQVDEDFVLGKDDDAFRFSAKDQYYTLWGKDINGATPETYMSLRRYKSVQSVLFLFMCQILDNPEMFEWKDYSGSGRFALGNEYQGEGSWRFRFSDPENEDISEWEGSITLKKHPWIVGQAKQTIRWKFRFDDVKDIIDDLEYSIRVKVQNTGIVDPNTAKVFPLKEQWLEVQGRGKARRYGSVDPLPNEVIQHAIDLASAQLKSRIPRYKTMNFREVEQDQFRKSDKIGPGRFALMLMALSARKDVGEDDVVCDAFLRCISNRDRMQKKGTYTISLYLLACHEILRSASDSFDETQLRQIKELGRYLAARLIKDLRPLEGWGYPINPANLSTTQFALLGLYAAVEREWLAADDSRLVKALLNTAKVLFRTQQRKGESVPLHYPAFGRAPRNIEARGWSYNVAYSVGSYGSMTVAGIGSQAIIYRLLHQAQALRPNIKTALEDSIDAGLAWMTTHYSVEKSYWKKGSPPGFELDEYYHYYYLYAIEKAASLTGVKSMYLGHWYRDLALHLVSEQFPDGRFHNGREWGGSDVATAFGLLVLKNASFEITKDLPVPSDKAVTEDK